jgi:CcmD family protein
VQGSTYLVIAYAVIWVGLLAYLGWIALRVRGVSAELEAVRELVDAHDQPASGGTQQQ